MKIAVTGSGGFIGKALVGQLQAEGHEILSLSRGALSEPDFSGVDVVIHCAALAHRTGAGRPDAATFDAVNHRLTVRLAEQARQAGVRRFVFVSTIHTIAGNRQPLTTGMPLAPRDDYGRAKAQAEAALITMEGIEAVIARPVLVYGPGARANLHALMKLCDSRLPLPFGLASNKRSLVSLENVARALVFLAEMPAEKLSGRIFHLAEPETRSTRELVTKARQALGRPLNLLPVPPCIMKLLLSAVGKSNMYEQLFGDLIVDGTTIERAGFRYRPGEGQLAAMAITARDI